jgi:hypothetical protein
MTPRDHLGDEYTPEREARRRELIAQSRAQEDAELVRSVEDQITEHLGEALRRLKLVEAMMPENTQPWQFALAAQLAVLITLEEVDGGRQTDAD